MLNLKETSLPPVVLLGGDANSLSIARDLAPRGVKVHVICASDASVRFSRHCSWINVPVNGSEEESWGAYLLSSESDWLQGAVLITCSDAGIGVIARHRDRLATKYKLEASNPSAALAMLDKLSTFQIAREAGVTTPDYWVCRSRSELNAIQSSLKFPLLVKPRLSHLFQSRFGKKFIIASNLDELMPALDLAAGAGIETMLVELIPGGDDALCSYYTYLDDDLKPLFHFTKRVIRRYPTGMGTGCYHITDWVPEIVEPALKLLTRAGVKGFGNVEFKLDPRDGQYKLMECNARFTAANCLVTASGFCLSEFVYNRIVGLPTPAMTEFKRSLRLWDGSRDFTAFLELRRQGKLSLGGWLRSILHRQTFPYFRWTDPGPALGRMMRPMTRKFRKLLNREQSHRTPAPDPALVSVPMTRVL